MKHYIQPQIHVVELEQETPILDTSITSSNRKPTNDNNMNLYSAGHQGWDERIWESIEEE